MHPSSDGGADDVQVGSILNFSLMYFLAPTAGASAAGANILQKLFSEQTLRSWGAPGRGF